VKAPEGAITTQYQANALNQYSQITYPDAKYLSGEVAVGTTSIEVNKQPATNATGFNLLLWSSLQGLVSNENDFYIKTTEGSEPPKVEKRLALSPTGSLAPSYDLDGNLLQDALWDYEWNAENRLVKQTHRADLTLDQLERVQLEFVYDSQGRRVKKTVSTWNGSSFVPASETLFLYDGWNLMAEIDNGSQSMIKSYTWGMDLSGSIQGAGGVGGLLSLEKGADVFLPSYDHNGNITAYNDASGSVVAEFEYDPFGRLIRETGDHAKDVVHRFSTKYEDAESGYYYYGFRYYDPETSRWLNRDPIEEQGGFNLYGFVKNDGINRWDYLGWYFPDRMGIPVQTANCVVITDDDLKIEILLYWRAQLKDTERVWTAEAAGNADTQRFHLDPALRRIEYFYNGDVYTSSEVNYIAAGALTMHAGPPLDIPGMGHIAIRIWNITQHGRWLIDDKLFFYEKGKELFYDIPEIYNHYYRVFDPSIEELHLEPAGLFFVPTVRPRMEL